MKNILSVKQFSKEEVEQILVRGKVMEDACKSGNVPQILKDKIVACVFFEPSTRTRLSFETATLKLGGKVITVENAMESSSAYKGESIEDTTRMLCLYADAVVMRHPQAGTLDAASKVASKPMLNAGDGGNQHPSQALFDLYTIRKHLGRLDNLKVAFGFDPKHSRTIKSLAFLLTHYPNNHFTFVCPKALNPTLEFLEDLKQKGVNFEMVENLDNFKDYDVFYANRLQGERFEDKNEYEKYRKALILTKDLVEGSKAIILDPLPRIDEIEVAVDDLPNAKYFDQAQNGLYVRMALLCYSLDL